MIKKSLLPLIAAIPALAGAASAATVSIPLAYNFNGIVHAGESGNPDSTNGYRSISDRGLDFTGGVPSTPLLDKYGLWGLPNTPDIVHLGNRNTVDRNGPGGGAFDLVADGDAVGTQPSWLATPDQSVPQTTNIAGGILLDASSSASFIYHISNGGGDFEVVFTFNDASTQTSVLSGEDWFGGTYAGTDDTDNGRTGAAGLYIEEGTINLSAHAGKTLTAVTFQNRSNANAGYAIFAGNVEGTAVPEPGAVALLGLGGLMALRRRRA